jgi:hypothetical protein
LIPSCIEGVLRESFGGEGLIVRIYDSGKDGDIHDAE